MHPFEKHYTEDIERIKLNGVTFHVKLPTRDNKRFQRLVVSGLVDFDAETGDYTQRKVEAGELVEMQVDAFIKTCIRKVEGWDDYTLDKMLALPEACEELWEEAIKVSNDRETEADAAAKKSRSTSRGPANGDSELTSTNTLKKTAG